MNNAVTIDFHGAEILGLHHTGAVYIAIKPIVEAMGLSWPSQFNRLKRDPILSKGIFKMTIPSRGGGGPQEYICLTLKRVAGWLFTINSNQIKNPEVRSRVQLFQEECYDVLHNYFFGQRSEHSVLEANESINQNLQLVRESRLIWGERTAAQMWDRLGLPTVPAMAEVFRDLFNWRETHWRAA